MYMYYLLGYRLLGNNDESIYSNQSDVGKQPQVPINSTQMTHRSKIFRSMNHFQRAQVNLEFTGPNKSSDFLVLSVIIYLESVRYINWCEYFNTGWKYILVNSWWRHWLQSRISYTVSGQDEEKQESRSCLWANTSNRHRLSDYLISHSCSFPFKFAIDQMYLRRKYGAFSINQNHLWNLLKRVVSRFCRPYGMVSEIWICHRSLAPESSWTHVGLCALLPRLLLLVPRFRHHGRQCDANIRYQINRSKTLRAIRSR